ncbi:MAG TPA: TAT-variant-translocated molybdopterin oxidoreductase, partial [Myxococcota bacterium]|nr:TAT-variant-translocated molybdopterin oxidoreductase [Myxococcota bacterium]
MSPLADDREQALWCSLDELSTSDSLKERFFREFPKEASIWAGLETEQSRREFLKLMGASFALAGIASCTKMPAEKIFPFTAEQSERLGYEKLFFASSSSFNGYAKGILVESHQGRPTKIEGNALHPASLGATDIFSQAEILSLYDPMRSKGVLHLGEISTWAAFEQQIASLSKEWQENLGEGVRILTNTVTSPTLANGLQSFLKQFARAKWHTYDVINSDFVAKGANMAFDQDLRPLYRFEQASVIVSLDADFLGPNKAQQAYARAFVERRKITNKDSMGRASFNRLYMVDSSVSLTGSCADHRIILKPSQMLGFALLLAKTLGLKNLKEPPAWTKVHQKEINAIASDLLNNMSRCIVLAGDQQPPAVHVVTHAINDYLQNHGKTVIFIAPPEANKMMQAESLKDLIKDLSEGKVSTLVMLGTNPMYASPEIFGFAKNVAKAKLKIHFGLYENETSYLCEWHLPESHFLETFGDAKAFDGTVSLIQPLIAPLNDSRSASELLAILRGDAQTSSYKLLKNYWEEQGMSKAALEKAIHDGLIENVPSPSIKVRLRENWFSQIQGLEKSDGLEISFKPDPTIWDGRYANNGWLQELPKPILQLTWDNAALLSPHTAKKLAIDDEDRIELRIKDRKVEAPALVIPGHPDDAITVYFGYGRTRATQTGINRGFDAYKLFDGESYFSKNIKIRKQNAKWELARTHVHYRMEDRQIVRRGDLKEYLKSPQSIVANQVKKSSLLKNRLDARYAWAMVIDLTSCIGCNTCTIACQAENNIPIVGKAQVQNAREMHWIRVDRYYEGKSENPKTFFQPVPCMHCETAPCEVVCPTAATNHSREGINQMVYNRCVGTRYCSNNCPYKVRRFNFLHYADSKTRNFRLMYNPSVTVRS